MHTHQYLPHVLLLYVHRHYLIHSVPSIHFINYGYIDTNPPSVCTMLWTNRCTHSLGRIVDTVGRRTYIQFLNNIRALLYFLGDQYSSVCTVYVIEVVMCVCFVRTEGTEYIYSYKQDKVICSSPSMYFKMFRPTCFNCQQY